MDVKRDDGEDGVVDFVDVDDGELDGEDGGDGENGVECGYELHDL